VVRDVRDLVVSTGDATNINILPGNSHHHRQRLANRV